MKLSIENYNLLNFNNDSIIISPKGVSRVTSPSLLDVLKKLQNRTSISEADLSSLLSEHHLDYEDAYRSLEKSVGLKSDRPLFFEKIIVAHDWEDREYLESLLADELPDSTITCPISELTITVNNETRYLIAITYQNYDYNELKSIYFQLASTLPESAIIICYPAGASYVIGQPHVQALGNACHFCSIDRVISHETYKPSKNTWSNLLNFCQSRYIPTPSALPTLYQKALIIGALVQKIKFLTGTNGACRYQDNILQETNISLSNGQVSESSVSHRCMCDCLRNIK